jgi:LysM repeat protein
MITDIFFYIVQPHDTLSRIARQYNASYREIAIENRITNPDLIYPGERLKLQKTRPSHEASALHELLRRESNHKPHARNGSHYGIGQLTPENARRYGGYGIGAVQRYIADRYGSSAAALRHHDQHGWY